MDQHTSFKEFLNKFPVRNFQKGEIVICEGLEPRRCYAIKSGFAKVFLTTKSGEEKAVNFVTAQDIFPLTWIFGKTDAALYYYQAFTDCEMYEIPRDDLVQHAEDDPQMFRRLFDYVLDLNIDLMQHIHSLEQAKAADKLMYAFNFLDASLRKASYRNKD